MGSLRFVGTRALASNILWRARITACIATGRLNLTLLTHKEDTVDTNKVKRGRPDRAGKLYRSPRLIIYGDLRRLTQAKGGTMGDGGGKPSSRASGAQA
jgi:hypothetical protein